MTIEDLLNWQLANDPTSELNLYETIDICPADNIDASSGPGGKELLKPECFQNRNQFFIMLVKRETI